jgi:hypothetical protein
MEPFEDKVRITLVLARVRVSKVDKGLTGIRFVMELPGGPFTITADVPIVADVQVGDLLTLYTEVLADAIPSSPPIQ